MTELQTILKETLTLWEAETQQVRVETTLVLNGQTHRILALEIRQKEIEQDLQRLISLYADLEPLLQRLSTALSIKSSR